MKIERSDDLNPFLCKVHIYDYRNLERYDKQVSQNNFCLSIVSTSKNGLYDYIMTHSKCSGFKKGISFKRDECVFCNDSGNYRKYFFGEKKEIHNILIADSHIIEMLNGNGVL